jgi:hypothetical protein
VASSSPKSTHPAQVILLFAGPFSTASIVGLKILCVHFHSVYTDLQYIFASYCYGWCTHPGHHSGHAKHGGRKGRQASNLPHVTSRIGRIGTGGLATWRTGNSPTVQQSNSPGNDFHYYIAKLLFPSDERSFWSFVVNSCYQLHHTVEPKPSWVPYHDLVISPEHTVYHAQALPTTLTWLSVLAVRNTYLRVVRKNPVLRHQLWRLVSSHRHNAVKRDFVPLSTSPILCPLKRFFILLNGKMTVRFCHLWRKSAVLETWSGPSYLQAYKPECYWKH